MIFVTAVRRVLIVATLVASLSMGACGGEDGPLVPAATLPQGTTTTNSYAVPAVIDEAYVNRVLAGLDQVVGDAVRLLVQTKTLDEGVFSRLKAVSSGDVLQLKLDGLQRDLLIGMSRYQPNPGNKVTLVQRLLSVSPSCLFAEVTKDFSAVNISGDSNLSTQWVGLVPSPAGTDFENYNPTRWIYIYDGLTGDRSQPSDPCAAIS